MLIELNIAIWLLPIIFMLHDFEEIIMIRAWKQRNHFNDIIVEGKNDFLSTKTPYSDMKSTASLSIGVAVEFLLFSLASLVSIISGFYHIWFACMFGLTVHYIIHLKMCIGFKGYVPGITTSVFCFPASVVLLIYVARVASFSVLSILVSGLAGILLLFILVRVLHRLMGCFIGLLDKYKVNKN